MDFFDFPSDDDKEIFEYISRATTIRQVFPHTDLFNIPPENEFMRRFRLSKATTLILLQQIEQHLKFDVGR